MEISEGNEYLTKLRRQGESYYILVTPEMKDYLGLEKPEEDVLIIKAENSRKWGHYFGIGKNKR